MSQPRPALVQSGTDPDRCYRLSVHSPTQGRTSEELDWPISEAHVLRIVRTSWAPDASHLRWSAVPLGGGLDGAPVSRVSVEYCAAGTWHRRDLVVKALRRHSTREAVLYERWIRHLAPKIGPRFLGTVWHCPESCSLFIEYVSRATRWPWRDVNTARALLHCLAQLHQSSAPQLGGEAWDYDAELIEAGRALQAFIERSARGQSSLAFARRTLPAVRRLVEALPTLRRQLRDVGPFGPAALHGDVHPGNAIVRRRGDAVEPVLLDWGRARLGSPLEDVSSWLQSLGYWEPAVRRRHDTLLRSYLVARGGPDQLGRDIRDAYWLAAACNVLAGAALYHLGCASKGERTHAGDAHRAAADALRIVRRADACWR
jgi:hypothetical protein